MALLTTNCASLVMGFSEIVNFQARQRVLISLFHRTEVAFVKIFTCKAYFVFRCETEFRSRPSCSLCFPSTSLSGRAPEVWGAWNHFLGGCCLQNCRPSSYCDTQTPNFPNSPLGGDVVLWRNMEETGQQAPESGLWAQIPVPSSLSSCVALVKSLNRLQLVFKMEKKKIFSQRLLKS